MKRSDAQRPRMSGQTIATVVSLDDPDGEGKVLLELQTQEGRRVLAWAPVVTPMAGNGRGLWAMPEEGDEVLCGFLYGDPEHPYMLGALYNGKDKPPSTSYRERRWSSLVHPGFRMLDKEGEKGDFGAVVIEDHYGNRITLSNGKITVSSVCLVEFKAEMFSFSGSGWRRVMTPNNNPL